MSYGASVLVVLAFGCLVLGPSSRVNDVPFLEGFESAAGRGPPRIGGELQ